MTTTDRVIGVVSRALLLSPLTVRPDTPLSALDVDSLEIAEIVMDLEAEFGVAFLDADMPALHAGRVFDLVALVEQHQGVPA